LVRPAKAKRIGIALHSFGYDPNTLARSLRVDRAQTLVVLFPLVNNVFLGNTIRTIRFESRHSGFTVMLLPDQEDAEVQQEQLARLSGYRRWHPSCPAAEANVAQDTSNSW
jgi:DNA-binding LacI/PurR family transcriptional regulator